MGCVWVLREVGEWKFVLCLWFHFGGRVGWGSGDGVCLVMGEVGEWKLVLWYALILGEGVEW